MIPLWRLTTFRRKLFESAGSRRYSRPGFDGMEEKLVSLLDSPGFFVEAGAVDGFFESNTYYLERFHGWRGVLVEPVPDMYSRLKVNRPGASAFNCALVSNDFTGDSVSLLPAHAMTKVAGPDPSHAGRSATSSEAGRDPIRVPARTLTSVLDEARAPARFDLLSLDVEGYETEVLKGLDFAKYKPRFILVECLDGQSRADMDDFLHAHYDMQVALSYRDFMYRLREG